MSARVLLTGATGFLGRELLARLLDQGREVLVVARDRPGQPARERIHHTLDSLGTSRREGLTVAAGDVRAEGLGLDASGRSWLDGAGPVSIIHSAAEVRFHLPLETMRAHNVGAVQNVLRLAESLGDRLERVDHVSTAYVAGDRVGRVLESEGDAGQIARNPYEASKLEAEEVVRAAPVPWAIHRPSIIVGDASSGRAGSFKVLYWPLSIYARGRFRTVFGRASCPLDVVPVDFVADAILRLSQQPEALGRAYHLCAGPELQTTVGEVGELARDILGGRPLRFVDPDFYTRYLRPWVLPVLRRIRPEVARSGGVYLPYLRSNPEFDVREREARLGPECSPPPVARYFETVLRFALATDFGRRPAD